MAEDRLTKEVVSVAPPPLALTIEPGRAFRFLSKRPHSTEATRPARRTGNSRLRSHHTTTTPAVSTHSPTIFRHTARRPGPASSLDSLLINDSRLSTSTPVSLCSPAAPVYITASLATPKKETKPSTPPAHITPPPAPLGCRRRLSCQSASHLVADRASRP
jgi:hypothetical protein